MLLQFRKQFLKEWNRFLVLPHCVIDPKEHSYDTIECLTCSWYRSMYLIIEILSHSPPCSRCCLSLNALPTSQAAHPTVSPTGFTGKYASYPYNESSFLCVWGVAITVWSPSGHHIKLLLHKSKPCDLVLISAVNSLISVFELITADLLSDLILTLNKRLQVEP